jgi:hypothetical protein
MPTLVHAGWAFGHMAQTESQPENMPHAVQGWFELPLKTHTGYAGWAFGKIAFKQRQKTTYWPSYSRKKQSLVRVFNVAGRITKPLLYR